MEIISSSFLWAKTGAEGSWHCLTAHLLDVSAVAMVMMERLPKSVSQDRLKGFGSIEEGMVWVAFFAGAHDVGKANRFFQAKNEVQKARLLSSGFDLDSEPEPKDARHGYATGVILEAWLLGRHAWSKKNATAVARAVGGHHGKFFSDAKPSKLGLKHEPWSSFGMELLDVLAQGVGVGDLGQPDDLNVALGWLCGLVSVADWVGSSERMVTFEESVDAAEEYFAVAKERAKRVLDEIGWVSPGVGEARKIREILPEGATPNGLQTAAEMVALEGASFVIVEAPTGEGKTEAALVLCEAARSTGQGIFFALPTMATANGLYSRVEKYLACENRLRLLHSKAWLMEIRTVPSEGDLTVEPEAQDWFGGAKRGLISPYGVGTIDQALIGILRTRHFYVRLFALAGKTVVVDEVHAYDVYMGDLLLRLLQWLKVLGCRVVLMSATLPKVRRDALVRAWSGKPVDGGYPGLTVVGDDGKVMWHPVNVGERKRLHMKPVLCSEEVWKAGADQCIKLLEDGGCAALILNTVGDAQKAARYLGEVYPYVQVELFHARFTANDRELIESKTLVSFGKDREGAGGRLLVATQVVEQSLDLDFDHMVTALAPVDLLIQRAGRLHRHKRDLTDRLTMEDDMRPEPTLDIYVGTDCDGEPMTESPIYDAWILRRTWRALEDGRIIDKAADVSRVVEEVYDESGRDEIVREADERQAAEWSKYEKGKKYGQDKADEAVIFGPGHENWIHRNIIDQDENDDRLGSVFAARTRLEDRPSLTLVLVTEDEARMMSVRELAGREISVSPPAGLFRALLELPRLDSVTGSKRHGKKVMANLHESALFLDGYRIWYEPPADGEIRLGLVWERI